MVTSAAAAALLISCGGGASSTTTITQPASTTTITEPAGTTGTTTAERPTDPSEYATAFVDAWERGDEPTARTLATTEAFDTLFATPSGGPGTWQVDACEGAAGSSYCTFTSSAGDSIVVRVENERATRGEPGAVDEVRIGT